MERRVIEKLKKSISRKEGKDQTELLEEILADSVDILASEQCFYSLPMKNLLNIIKKSKISDPNILKELAKGIDKYKGKDGILLLTIVDSNKCSRQDYIEIIQCFQSCPICNHLWESDHQPNGGMKIYVKTLFGNFRPFVLNVKPTYTIKHVKDLIQDKDGIPPNQMKLIYSRMLLEDEKTLQYYSIKNNTEIQYDLRFKG